jgi:hypothetical protein
MTTMTSTVLTATSPTAFLRQALWADAIVSGATGLVLAAAAGPLAAILQLPAGLLRVVGLAFLPYAAFVAAIARRDPPPHAGVRAAIAGNALWAAVSVAVLFTGWIDPSRLGIAFILFQAVVVAGFAELQAMGLRRAAGR